MTAAGIDVMKVGLIGCGTISPQYLRNLPAYPGVEVAACSDIIMDRARSRAQEFGVPIACTTEELLANPDIDIAVNLTVPADHLDVSLTAIAAGKHVYSEKPLTVEREDGDAILSEARKAGVFAGCAPDTFLGAGIQTCRKLIDDGRIGRPVAAMASMLGHGHEHWHPDPAFYYQVGGRTDVRHGPLLPHRTGSLARPREAGIGRPRPGFRPQADHQRAVEWHDDGRRSFHPRCRDTRLRERGDRHDSHQLRRLDLRDPLDGDLRHRRHSKRARPQHVQWPGSASARTWRVGGGSHWTTLGAVEGSVWPRWRTRCGRGGGRGSTPRWPITSSTSCTPSTSRQITIATSPCGPPVTSRRLCRPDFHWAISKSAAN